MVQFVEGRPPLGFQGVSYGTGFALAAALGVAVGIKALTENAYFHIVTRAGWQVRRCPLLCLYYGLYSCPYYCPYFCTGRASD